MDVFLRRFGASVIVFLVFVESAVPYGKLTHVELGLQSSECSVLSDSGFMEDIGLKGLAVNDSIWSAPTKGSDPGWIGSQDDYAPTISFLIAWGAEYEDTGQRGLNHFLDPFASGPMQVVGYEFNSSPVWALGEGIVPSFLYSQENSLADAYGDLSLALGEQGKTDRDRNWGRFFQSLGMLIHHVHDMAQPEHVRQDMHCDSLLCVPFGLYEPSYYEKYTDDHIARIIAGYGCDSYASLDLADFSKARDFWDTDRGQGIGMAEFTNRNFVSSDTNFRRRFTSLLHAEVAADPRYPDPGPQNGGEGPKIVEVSITDPELRPLPLSAMESEAKADSPG